MKANRYIKPGILKSIEPALLVRFIESFSKISHGNGFGLPAPQLPHPEYVEALIRLLMNPKDVPDRLSEALEAIDELSAPAAERRLEAALQEAGVNFAPETKRTRVETAMELWLVAPPLLIHYHNRCRLLRLTSFSYFGSKHLAQRPSPFTGPDEARMALLTENLDDWFARHHRGRRTVKVQRYEIDEEHWFLVRHGDILTRAPKVEEQHTELIYFRPEKDDVVVYVPEQERVRINARSKGERELYRREFGLCLHGDADYFSESNSYTLEPLREHGSAALDPEGVEGIAQIRLCELEVETPGQLHEVNIRAADDLFQCEPPRPGEGPIPREGRLVRAAFRFKLCGCRRPRLVQVCPPNTLKLSRHCHPHAVHRWLSRRGFLAGNA